LINGFIAHPAVPVGRLRPFPWCFMWICQVALYLHMLPLLTETRVLAWFRQHLCRLVYVSSPMTSFFFLSFSFFLFYLRFHCSSTFNVGWQAVPTVYKFSLMLLSYCVSVTLNVCNDLYSYRSSTSTTTSSSKLLDAESNPGFTVHALANQPLGRLPSSLYTCI